MSRNPFRLPFDQLPATLPIFPLADAVVMPGCQLPLNVFEPRYLNLVLDALGGERLIGMLQPEGEEFEGVVPNLYRVGTAGRISLFQETEDGRLLIMLNGVCRFAVCEEIPTDRGYRRMEVDWSRFRIDYDEPVLDESLRAELLEVLRDYFSARRLEVDWEVLGRLAVGELVDRLIATLPIEVAERQMLVETIAPADRLQRLLALLKCSTMPSVVPSGRSH